MTDINALKNAITGPLIQTGQVVKIDASAMSISTPKGVLQTAPLPGIKKGDRVTIKQGVITPINAKKAAVFYL